MLRRFHEVYINAEICCRYAHGVNCTCLNCLAGVKRCREISGDRRVVGCTVGWVICIFCHAVASIELTVRDTAGKDE